MDNLNYRFQHFISEDLLSDRIPDLIEDAAARRQIKPHAQLGWEPVFYNTRAITVCTVEDKDRNVVARGYAFFTTPNVERRLRRKIAQGRARKDLLGRDGLNREKRAAREVNKLRHFEKWACTGAEEGTNEAV